MQEKKDNKDNDKNEKKKKSKKKIVVTLLCILSVLIITGVVIAVLQWNNITAARYYLTNSIDEINAKINDNDKKVADILNEIAPLAVRDLTAEEKALYASESITKEEAIKRLVDDAKASGTDTETPALDDPDSRLAELVAEAFVLRAYYTNQLEAMRVLAAAEYSALNKEEGTQPSKTEFAISYIRQAGVLEDECDRLMDDLVARIETELRRTGADISYVRSIKSYYAEEKSLKKAYYLSLYS